MHLRSWADRRQIQKIIVAKERKDEGEKDKVSNNTSNCVAAMSSTISYRAGEMTEGYKDMPSFLVGCTSEKGEEGVGTMIIRFEEFREAHWIEEM